MLSRKRTRLRRARCPRRARGARENRPSSSFGNSSRGPPVRDGRSPASWVRYVKWDIRPFAQRPLLWRCDGGARRSRPQTSGDRSVSHLPKLDGELGRPMLRTTLAATNPIESLNSLLEEELRRIKRRRNSEYFQRWLATACPRNEQRTRRVKVHRGPGALAIRIGQLCAPQPESLDTRVLRRLKKDQITVCSRGHPSEKDFPFSREKKIWGGPEWSSPDRMLSANAKAGLLGAHLRAGVAPTALHTKSNAFHQQKQGHLTTSTCVPIPGGRRPPGFCILHQR